MKAGDTWANPTLTTTIPSTSGIRIILDLHLSYARLGGTFATDSHDYPIGPAGLQDNRVSREMPRSPSRRRWSST
jgi:hypothetical protein